MRKLLLLQLVALFYASGMAQISHGGDPKSIYIQGLKSDIDYKIMPDIDVQTLLEEDAMDEKNGDVPWRFGKEIEVNFNLNNSGTWELLENGDRIWRLEITSYGAYSLNLIYDEFEIPSGASFFVYNEQKSHIIGAFTQKSNKSSGTFATVPVRGETSILEYYEPKDVIGQGKLSVSYVIHAYKNILSIAEKGFGSSGACNINVNCPEGDEWRDQQRGVAMILTSTNNRICSGSMINNTAEDGTPYFLTANHCGSGVADTWIIMFNYESPSCENIDGPTDQSIQNTTVRATSYVSDLLLLELSEVPPQEYNVYYNGWNRSDDSSSHSVAIHHPRGDIKKISFDNDSYSSDKYVGSQGISNSHWKIEQWDLGTTEGGSSGSPLFNPQKQIVGQLHGGYASCTSLTSDWYGKVSYSWDYFDEPERQLKHWLDPLNLGVESIDGFDAGAVQYNLDAKAFAILEPQSEYTENATFNPKIVVKNNGLETISSLSISYMIDDIISDPIEWTGDLEPSDTAIIVFQEEELGSGLYDFKAFCYNPNGLIDDNPYNDTIAKTVEVFLSYDIAISEFFSPTDINCDLDDLRLDFMVKNEGSEIIYGFSYQVMLDGEQIYSGQNNQFLDPDEEQYVTYPLQVLDTDWHNLELTIDINDHEDQNPENNFYSSDFNAFGNRLEFNLITDNAASETSWVLTNSLTGPVESENEFSNNYKYKYSFCLEAGCYAFTIYDEAENGIDLSIGSFSLVNLNSGNTYFESAEFTDEIVVEFCITDNLYSDFTIDPGDNCTNSEIRFYNLSVNADAYVWNFEGGTPGFSTDVSPLIKYEEIGTYDVVLVASNNNESNTLTRDNYITVVNCSGLEEVQSDLFNIYPNPSSGIITLDLLKQNEFEELIIYNAIGEVLENKRLDHSEIYHFNLNLSSGLYYIELKSSKLSEKRMLLIND